MASLLRMAGGWPFLCCVTALYSLGKITGGFRAERGKKEPVHLPLRRTG